MAISIILGAGASRGVSYSRESDMPSPLDRDFFDLLQRLEPQKKDTPFVEILCAGSDACRAKTGARWKRPSIPSISGRTSAASSANPCLAGMPPKTTPMSFTLS